MASLGMLLNSGVKKPEFRSITLRREVHMKLGVKVQKTLPKKIRDRDNVNIGGMAPVFTAVK
jgi:hypothetical protein